MLDFCFDCCIISFVAKGMVFLVTFIEMLKNLEIKMFNFKKIKLNHS